MTGNVMQYTVLLLWGTNTTCNDLLNLHTSTVSDICYYPETYGNKAKKCWSHCLYSVKSGNNWTTGEDKQLIGNKDKSLIIFLTDTLTKRKFLVDTGAMIILFAHRSRVTPCHMQLIAANGQPIPF